MNGLSTFPFTCGNAEGKLRAAQDTNQKVLTRAKKPDNADQRFLFENEGQKHISTNTMPLLLILHIRLFDSPVAGTRQKFQRESLEKPKILNRNIQESSCKSTSSQETDQPLTALKERLKAEWLMERERVDLLRKYKKQNG